MNELKRQVCATCLQEKPIEDFYMRTRDGSPQGRMKVCRECHKARVRHRTAERKAEASRAARARRAPAGPDPGG